MPAPRATESFPPGTSVLAVCAHPDDESFGLGAVLHRLAAEAARTSVLCFTHGEASTLGPLPTGLRDIRGAELTAAAKALGVGRVELFDHPDGALAAVPLEELVEGVARTMTAVDHRGRPDGEPWRSGARLGSAQHGRCGAECRVRHRVRRTRPE
jgi:LmbE family N-acetylglucosaminyl deacetylase